MRHFFQDEEQGGTNGPQREYQNPPDGEYVASLDDVVLEDNMTLRCPVLLLKWKLKDRKHTSFMRLNFNDKGAKFIRWQMGVLEANSLAMQANPKNEDEVARAYQAVLADYVGQEVVLKLETRRSEKNGKDYQGAIITQYPVVATPRQPVRPIQTAPRAQTTRAPQQPAYQPAPQMDTDEPLPF